MGCSASTSAAFTKNVMPLLEEMVISDAKIAMKHIDIFLSQPKLPKVDTINLQALKIRTLEAQLPEAPPAAAEPAL